MLVIIALVATMAPVRVEREDDACRPWCVGGLATALAAQKSLENLYRRSFHCLWTKPYMSGTSGKIGDQVGTVEDIGLRSIKMRTLDQESVGSPYRIACSSMRNSKTWLVATSCL